MFYISFHGGKKGLNNLWSFNDQLDAKSGSKVLPGKPDRDELRGFVFNGDDLFVVNANMDHSQVLHYRIDESGDYAPVGNGIFASKDSANSILHPFQFIADGTGYWLLSSQDTNLVTRLDASGNATGPAPWLRQSFKNGAFLSGTWVASSKGDLPNAPSSFPLDVPQPQGLAVDIDPKTQKMAHSVRGLAIYGQSLFVADEPGNEVKVYDLTSGELRARIVGDNLASPVHLLIRDDVLYIGSTGNDSIVTFALSGGSPQGKCQPQTFVDGNAKSPSGMTFDESGNFYVAERVAQKVFRFDKAGGNKTQIGDKLNDQPEFILWAANDVGK